MCLVLEKEQPLLCFALNVHVNLNGTSIDFLRLVKLCKVSVCLKILGSDSRNIHKVYGLRYAKLLADVDIVLVSFLKKLVLKLHVVNCGKERGVTAMVGPVRVNHLDFSNGRISVLCLKIVLTEGKVVNIHCKALLLKEHLKLRLVVSDKALQGLNLCRNIVVCCQRLRLLEGSLPALHRVNEMLLYCRNVSVAELSVKHIHTGSLYNRSVAL